MGSYSRKIAITNEVLILDGLTGSGKAIFGPLLSCLSGIQPGRFEYMVEYLSIVSKSGHLELDAAKSLIGTLIDVKTYDNSISREVNFRPYDSSSVLKHGDFAKTIYQLVQKDGVVAVEKLKSNPQVPFFITHQLFGCLDLLSETYGDGLSIIEMIRHPYFLYNHWLSYLPFHGASPHDFTLLLNVEGSEFPWFANSFLEEYINAGTKDRVALAISHLLQPIINEHLNSRVLQQTLVIPFEQFVLNPDSYLTKIEQHTGRTFSKRVSKVLKKQNIPRNSVLNNTSQSIFRIRGIDPKTSLASEKETYLQLENQILPLLSDSIREKFRNVASTYEAKFGLWF
jgi:hypothetical protein